MAATDNPLPRDEPSPAQVDAAVRATFESAPDGLVVLDRHGEVIALNSAFAAMWSFPPELLQRQHGAELRAFAMRLMKNPKAYLNGLRRLGQPGLVVDEIEHVDGRVFERQASPLGDTSFAGATVVRWRDVTARRLAEQALGQVRARLTSVFEHALNAILLADDQGRYLDANPAACGLLGRTRDQVLASTMYDVMAVSTPAAQAAWGTFLVQGTATGQVSLLLPDGSTRLARFSAVAHIQPGVHLSILSDITDEQAARQRQVETAAQMEAAMASADVVFWSVDLVADEIGAANPDWLRQMLGYDPAEIAPGMAAWDALVHPDDAERRKAPWDAHVQGHSPVFEAEFRMRHKDGHWVWLLSRGRAIERDSKGQATRVVGTHIDITRRKLAEQLLEEQAFTDGLTHTLNRRRFLQLAEVEMERARRHGQPLALLMIDLDHFKAVNDQHGHAGGDAVLQAFVRTAQTVTRGSDLLGRVGGEEFAVVLPQTDLEGAAALALRLQAQVQAHPVQLPSGLVSYSASIGVAARRAGPDDGSSVETLMLAADTALYRAKGQGRNRVLMADPAA